MYGVMVTVAARKTTIVQLLLIFGWLGLGTLAKQVDVPLTR
jgi:hypothetical protein